MFSEWYEFLTRIAVKITLLTAFDYIGDFKSTYEGFQTDCKSTTWILRLVLIYNINTNILYINKKSIILENELQCRYIIFKSILL